MIIRKQLVKFYYKLFSSKEEYARHLGVKIGKKCRIAIWEWSSEPYLVTIGDNVAITKGVSIHTHGGGRVIRQYIPDFDSFGKVVIEDNVYIGSSSQIMPGVTIGKGSLVAAGSIVTKSVPENMVVGGNPAKVICTIQEYVERNLKYNIHCKQMNAKLKRAFLLSLTDDRFISK